MPAHEVYMLHIYRSRAIGGWQWAARLEHLPGGEQVRFTDPAALLAHLQTVIQPGDRPEIQADIADEEAGPERAAEEGEH